MNPDCPCEESGRQERRKSDEARRRPKKRRMRLEGGGGADETSARHVHWNDGSPDRGKRGQNRYMAKRGFVQMFHRRPLSKEKDVSWSVGSAVVTGCGSRRAPPTPPPRQAYAVAAVSPSLSCICCIFRCVIVTQKKSNS